MAEIPSAYTQRPVIVRQRRYAMVHPSCDALAQVLVDFPVKFVVIAVFDVILCESHTLIRGVEKRQSVSMQGVTEGSGAHVVCLG